MATNTKGFNNYVDAYGPSGGKIASANIALATGGALTVAESQGFASIVKSGGLGLYTLTLLRKCKNINVTLGLQSSSAAQSVIITGANPVTGVITLQVVTAGTNTAIEVTNPTTIHVQVLLRVAV